MSYLDWDNFSVKINWLTVVTSFQSEKISLFKSFKILFTFNGSDKIEKTFFCGSKEANGFWKVIWIFLYKNLRLARDILLPEIILSLNVTIPVDLGIKRNNKLATVVLPDPDSPINPMISPGCNWNETSSTALTEIFLLLKYFFKFITFKIGFSLLNIVFLLLRLCKCFSK